MPRERCEWAKLLPKIWLAQKSEDQSIENVSSTVSKVTTYEFILFHTFEFTILNNIYLITLSVDNSNQNRV